jgi:hypothetical protein
MVQDADYLNDHCLNGGGLTVGGLNRRLKDKANESW